MELAGVAAKLHIGQWQNETGECASREYTMGEKRKYKCQKDDGRKGGQKFLTSRDLQLERHARHQMPIE